MVSEDDCTLEPMDEPMELTEVHRLLQARRRQLADELADLTKPPEAGSNLSFGKRIGEGTTEAVERISSTATARSIAAALAEVERALEKVDEGTYGRCDDCGRLIAAERLETMPAATLCVSCSSRRSSR
jgi:DnaK suppressor protein